jgi:hypothetical protein
MQNKQFFLNRKEGRKATRDLSKIVGVIFSLTFLFLSFTSALDSYGTKKLNEQFTFCQVCSDSTYVTLSSIETPSQTIQVNENMTSLGSGQFCYNYTATQIGRHDFRGISDGCEKTFATYVDISTDGFINSIGFYVMILILSLGLVGFGLTIRDPIVTILGSFGLYFVSLYTLFNGIGAIKDPVYTWGIGLIVLGLAMYVSIRSTYELIVD